MDNKPLRVFGNTLKDLRVKRGISQEGLAAKAGIHRNYVGLVERGERNICLVNITKLARALESTPAVLLKNN
jgi:transcriptional regulator with XRE-family HTH domain